MNDPRPRPVGLLDTSVIILLERLEPHVLPARMLISTITLAELSVGPLVASSDAERAVRSARLRQAEDDFDTVPFDKAAAHAFGVVAASLRRVGRKPAARSFDAAIAATALAHDLPLFTANAGDVAHIDGLDVVSVRPT